MCLIVNQPCSINYVQLIYTSYHILLDDENVECEDGNLWLVSNGGNKDGVGS